MTAQQLKDKKPETLAESLQNVSGVSYANSTGGIFDAVLAKTEMGRSCEMALQLALDIVLMQPCKQ
ncbi:Plug domain-containing protein [Campylobacter concisus]